MPHVLAGDNPTSCEPLLTWGVPNSLSRCQGSCSKRLHDRPGAHNVGHVLLVLGPNGVVVPRVDTTNRLTCSSWLIRNRVSQLNHGCGYCRNGQGRHDHRTSVHRQGPYSTSI